VDLLEFKKRVTLGAAMGLAFGVGKNIKE